MKRSELIFSASQVPLDFAMVVLAAAAAHAIRFSGSLASFAPTQINLPFHEYLPFALGGGLIWVIIFALAGLYRLRVTRSVVEELFLVLVASLASFAVIAIVIFFDRALFNSRLTIVITSALAIVFIGIARSALKKFQQFLVGRFGVGVHRVLIVGRNRGGRTRQIIEELSRTRRFGYEVVGVEPALALEKIEHLIERRAVDDVFVTDLQYDRDGLLALVALCQRKGAGFHFTSGVFDTFRTKVHTLAALPITEVLNTPLDGWGRITKRSLDVFGSVIGVVVVGLMYFILGLIIKLGSPGPVILALERIGQNGKPFRLYKFRSMIDKAWVKKPELLASSEREGPLFKMKHDPRVTRVGRVIRRFRLDEFPQIFNVLKGDMSLVGPRPHEPGEVARYEQYQKRLLSVKPGITGFAQISGSSDLAFEQEVKLDTYYIENWSMLLDIKILIRTAVIMFFDRTAV